MWVCLRIWASPNPLVDHRVSYYLAMVFRHTYFSYGLNDSKPAVPMGSHGDVLCRVLPGSSRNCEKGKFMWRIQWRPGRSIHIEVENDVLNKSEWI